MTSGCGTSMSARARAASREAVRPGIEGIASMHERSCSGIACGSRADGETTSARVEE